MYGFRNDIIYITIEDPCWVERAKKEALLIIHTIFRPWKSDKPLIQDDPLSLSKLVGEGHLAKCKNCIGWDIQTLPLHVLLT